MSLLYLELVIVRCVARLDGSVGLMRWLLGTYFFILLLNTCMIATFTQGAKSNIKHILERLLDEMLIKRQKVSYFTALVVKFHCS